jgi:hypothetical protein
MRYCNAMPILGKFKVAAAALLKSINKRTSYANALMVSFIILTGIGAGLIFPPAGFLVAGVACGIFGFLLGLE